jgi:hypothetical protein
MNLLRRAIIQAIGGPLDISDVFSVDLLTASTSVVNGVNLSGDGGMVWLKSRDNNQNHFLMNTVSPTVYLSTNTTAAGISGVNIVSSFNTDGYSVGTTPSGDVAGWTFKKSPKFFDVIEYLGDGANRAIPHGLGLQAGIAIIKHNDGAGNNDWSVQHVSRGGLVKTRVNLTDSEIVTGNWNDITMDADNIYLGAGVNVNSSGLNYTMYIFAHDDSDEGVIQCGQYTGNGVSGTNEIALGWQPQYVMVKNVSGSGSWNVFDHLRGVPPFKGNLLSNLSIGEQDSSSYVSVTPTGFIVIGTGSDMNANGDDYIYMAIRGV